MKINKIIEEHVEKGYELLSRSHTIEACDVFLDVWNELKDLMDQGHIKDLGELQTAYPWSDFITNWVQDIEQELHNAGVENPEYHSKRIRHCEELLDRCGNKDNLLIENTRKAIAESHFALGNMVECDRLFQMWLDQDPTWGWGYIGWSDCYHLGAKNIAADQIKAEKIIGQALGVENLQDRADVVERAIEIYTAIGDTQHVTDLENELRALTPLANNPPLSTVAPAHVDHVGRNDPCPCGSGKKYKKCCGK